VSAEALRAVLRVPLLANLDTFEASSTYHATSFPFDVLLAERPRLAHLRRIVVGGHLVPPKVLKRFATWPEVTFVRHDRREVLALDLETTGWPFGSRCE
jgi:hypothetical protein